MTKNTPKLFTALGLVFCLAALLVAFSNRGRKPVMLRPPEDAAARVEALMDAVCAGDYAAADAMLYGVPELGLEIPLENVAAQVLRPAYRASLSYALRHDPYVTDTGLAVCVDVRSLDVALMTEKISAQLTDLPEAEAQALETWSAALSKIPPEYYPYTMRTITLNLIHDQGQWWILPEEPLLNVISGVTE